MQVRSNTAASCEPSWTCWQDLAEARPLEQYPGRNLTTACSANFVCNTCRPFVWRDEIFLGHWMAYLPGQERMALSVLNLREGKVELVHRFSALSEELEEIVARPEAPASVRPLRKLLPLGKAPFETPVFRCDSMSCNSECPFDTDDKPSRAENATVVCAEDDWAHHRVPEQHARTYCASCA